MTVKRLFAIGFIFVMTSVAWFILGGSLWTRGHLEERLSEKVRERWGEPLAQRAPEVREALRKEARQPSSSEVKVELALEYRQVGLLWYPTYVVVFDGVYGIENAGTQAATYEVTLRPPANMDEFVFQEAGAEDRGSAETHVAVAVPAGETRKVHVHYRSQGMGQWSYGFGEGAGTVRDFRLAARTNFRNVDFLTVSPTQKEKSKDGWLLTWRYVNSRMTSKDIVIEMPKRQNPGDLASRISFFAPVSLLFFFTVMVVIQVMKKVEIHPMNYFFIAAGFFAFNLLLAYLADHVEIRTSFFISAAVSVFLVVTYLRLVTGLKFAVAYAGISQLVFLVGLSYAFFYEGFAGLAVTIGAIVTLWVLMQVTGRVKWGEVFASKRRMPPPAMPMPPA